MAAIRRKNQLNLNPETDRERALAENPGRTIICS